MTTEKKRFTNYSTMTKAFTTQNGEKQERPFVIIEGNLTRDVELKAGKSTSYVFNAIGTSVSAEEVFARTVGKYSREEKYSDNQFFNLKFFGRNAERLAKIGKKGLKLVVWGEIEEDRFKDASGNEKKSIQIIVDNFVAVLGNGNGNGNEASATDTTEETAPATPEPEENLMEEVTDDDLPF